MGSKIKHRQMKKPRNLIAMDAIINHKGGSMRHRADRRPKENDDVRRYVREWNDPSSDGEDYDCEW